MIADFPRVLTLLRKEKGVSQKQAAADLQVSQALLSHYEKGIRECGLSFLVRCADYYEVSCDFLLGRSPERQGQTLKVEEIPEPDMVGKENMGTASVLPLLNKKLIANSLNILFDLLQKYNSKSLTNEVSLFLMLAVYKMFRCVFASNSKNPAWMFAIGEKVYPAFSSASMQMIEAKLNAAIAGDKISGLEDIHTHSELTLTTESIAQDYPLFASSLLNLIKTAEAQMKKNNK